MNTFKLITLFVLVAFAVPEATQSHLSFLAPKSGVNFKQQFKNENNWLKNLSDQKIKTAEEFNQLANSILRDWDKNPSRYSAAMAFLLLLNKAPTDSLKKQWLEKLPESPWQDRLFNRPQKTSEKSEEKKSKEKPKKAEPLPATQSKQEQKKVPTELELLQEGFLKTAQLRFNSLTNSKNFTHEILFKLTRESLKGKDKTLPKHAVITFNTELSNGKLFTRTQTRDKNIQGLTIRTPNNGGPKKMVVALNCLDPNDIAFVQFYTLTESKKLIVEELLIDKNKSVIFKNSEGKKINLEFGETTDLLHFSGRTVKIQLPLLAELLQTESEVLNSFYEQKSKDKNEKTTKKVQKQSAAEITLSAVTWPLAFLFSQIEFSSIFFFIVTLVVLYTLYIFADALFGGLRSPWAPFSLLEESARLKEDPFYLIEDPFDPDTDTDIDIDIEEAKNPTPLHHKVFSPLSIATAL